MVYLTGGLSDSGGFSGSAGSLSGTSSVGLSSVPSCLSSAFAGDDLQLGTKSGICSSMSSSLLCPVLVSRGRGCGRGGKVIKRRIELIQASTTFFMVLS